MSNAPATTVTFLEPDFEHGGIKRLNCTIPTNLTPEQRMQLKSAGFTLGEPLIGDELLSTATLPFGWVKLPTGHKLVWELRDSNNRLRATIHHNTDPYAPYARLVPRARFNIQTVFVDGNGIKAVVTDVDKVVFETHVATYKSQFCGEFVEAKNTVLAQAKAALDITLSNHQDTWAYWD